MRGPVWIAAGLVGVLVAAVLIVTEGPRPPYAQTGPSGYRIVAQYFGAGPGRLGPGVNVLAASPPADADWSRIKQAARAGAQIVVQPFPAVLRRLGVGGTLQAAPSVLASGWPDPVVGGRRHWVLGPRATCLSGSLAVPLIGSPACAALSYWPDGRGGFWLLGDTTFWANANIARPGHVQLLANLVGPAAALRFAAWPVKAAPPAGPPSLPTDALAAVAPTLGLWLWALAARFGPVRPEPARESPHDAAEGLASLLRRHQAGKAALEAVIGPRATGAAAAQIQRRIADGPVPGREAAQLYAAWRKEQHDG